MTKRKKIFIDEADLIKLLFMARRYADGRSTYAPSAYNMVLQRVYNNNPHLVLPHDNTLTRDGLYSPWAQDGMYNEDTGRFDARPIPSVIAKITTD